MASVLTASGERAGAAPLFGAPPPPPVALTHHATPGDSLAHVVENPQAMLATPVLNPGGTVVSVCDPSPCERASEREHQLCLPSCCCCWQLSLLPLLHSPSTRACRRWPAARRCAARQCTLGRRQSCTQRGRPPDRWEGRGAAPSTPGRGWGLGWRTCGRRRTRLAGCRWQRRQAPCSGWSGCRPCTVHTQGGWAGVWWGGGDACLRRAAYPPHQHISLPTDFVMPHEKSLPAATLAMPVAAAGGTWDCLRS